MHPKRLLTYTLSFLTILVLLLCLLSPDFIKVHPVRGVLGFPMHPEASNGAQTPSPENYAKGMWVKYQIKRSRRKGAGLIKIWDSDLKIISLGHPAHKLPVGLGKEGEQPASPSGRLTWLELIAQEGKDHQKVIRVLIDEQGELVKARVVVKHGVLPAAEIDLNLWAIKTRLNQEWLFEDFTGHLLILPINRRHSNETKLGKDALSLTMNGKRISLECDKYKVVSAATPSNHLPAAPSGEPRQRRDGQAGMEKRWYASDLPLSGLVKLLAIESSGPDEYHTQIILTGYGDQGTSLIIEKPMRLEFKER